MFIRSASIQSLTPTLYGSTPLNVATSAEAAENQVDTYVPFKEHAVKSAIIGASVGNVVGEAAGGFAMVGSVGYAGYRIGQALGGMYGAAAGAVLGVGTGYLFERNVPIGKTLGAVGGFVVGGVIGGLTGSVLGGVSAITQTNFFQKG